MPEQLWFTALLNRYFAGPIDAFLEKLPPQFHPANPQAPISNAVAMEFLVVLILIAFFFWVRSRLSVENPGKSQHLVEMLQEFIDDQSAGVITEHPRQFTPFLTALFVFILFSNLIGLIPSFESPTRTVTVPLGCAVVTFLYYNFYGLLKQGPIGYLKSFMGPIWYMAPLIFVIEVISHLARVLSLTVRLWANLFAGDAVTTMFFTMIPIGIPVVFLLLHVAVSFLQAYIFTLLSTIYLGLATAHEH